MQVTHNRFTANIGRARDLRALFINLNASTGSTLDLTDVLRAAIVSGVSAFDTFIHETTKIGMMEVYQNARPKTDAFGRFGVSMQSVLLVIATPGATKWLEAEISSQHAWLSFQQPDKVADAIRLFCGKDLWNEVGIRLATDAKTAKNRLALIVDRRNKIAHEADMDPTSPGSRWPIDELLVRDVIDGLEQIGNAIFLVVTAP